MVSGIRIFVVVAIRLATCPRDRS